MSVSGGFVSMAEVQGLGWLAVSGVFFTFPPPLTLSVTVAFGPNYPIRVIILITLSIIIKAVCLGLMIVEILQI